MLETEDGFVNSWVLIDLVSTYWTVGVEADAADLASFEQHTRTFASRPEVRDVMSGDLDLVDGGHREIYRVI